MKTNILVSLIAVIAVLAAGLVLASDVVDINKVEVNSIDASSGNVAVEAGEVVPVDIYFTANENASDVEISVWIRGERREGTEISFKDLIENREYHTSLSLRMPSDIDETEEEKTLFVRIETDSGNVEEEYTLTVQREPYFANLLFVEMDSKVQAGENVAVDIVVKNLGRHELADLIVKVSVPELRISKRAYFGDLTPTDECENDDDDECEDAIERRAYLKIPVNADAGEYEVIIEAYNSDTSSSVTKTITITGAEQASDVIVPVSAKEIAMGQATTYDLIIVNSGRKLGVYEIVPETAEGVFISVENPVVTIPAGLSRTVQVHVKAGSREGTYSFAVDVNSEGQLVKRAVMTANVVKGKAITGIGGNIAVLTIVLAIIFVVLLVVLIVLLTKKPSKAEELEESYY